ncbi:hypothetical protein HCJ66_11625 [Listeria sp. FSL L7-1582]|uniref:hypothetical protein n=1 Tax=Listeria portnoyi TaxID=2713504 RepID=UPI00164DDD23|nr:hypothetical protein [Listeria portnoyi]MBC6310188.1 hypothetical protein [Listeria portnoyi]
MEIDYVATSPKRLYSKMYEKRHLSRADEVRVVMDGGFNMLETISQLGKLDAERGENKWSLSIQTHKLAGIE